MKNSFNFRSFIAIFLTGALTFISGCTDPAIPQIEEEEENFSNDFTYNGNVYNIGSVVRFDQNNNTIQLWISETEGLTDIDAVEEAGDYLIVSFHKSYLGQRDRFTKPGSFIRFGNKVFASGDDGLGYIDTELSGNDITVKFAVKRMHTRAEDEEIELFGSYKGSFGTYNEPKYENQIGINRNRQTLSDLHMILREDGGSDTFILYDNTGKEALSLCLPQARRGLPTQFYLGSENTEGMKISYAGQHEIPLDQAYGTATVDFSANAVTVSVDITYNETNIKAEYAGGFTSETVKANRYIYESGSAYGTGYEGKFVLSELRVERYNNSLIFKFIPEGTDEQYSDIPILRITDTALIGKKKIDLRNTPGWFFEFDRLEVGCYENEFKPCAAEGSFLTLIETENGYHVDLELQSDDPYSLSSSTIDLHYNGAATIK